MIKERIKMYVSAYRKDNRSENQFFNDIKIGNQTEKLIISQYADLFKKKNGSELIIIDTGCGNEGEPLSEDQISTKADYFVNGRNLEVKFNNQLCRKFHFKASHLSSYIKQKANVLWVNGFLTDQPLYTIMKQNDLHWIRRSLPTVAFEGWGGKEAYQLEANLFHWKAFKKTRKPH
jgi:hypothetical protein